MNPRTIGRALGAAACALLFAVSLSARATALYDVSMAGTLTVDALAGTLSFEPVQTQPPSSSQFVDPSGYGTASGNAVYSNFLPVQNTVRVQADANGTALPSTTLFGTVSFGTGTAGGGVLVTNRGTDPVQLLILVDVEWAWTLLVDDPVGESATAALSLDLYSDGALVGGTSLVNLVALQANGSDSLNETFQLDLLDPLATLSGGESRLFALVASATGAATAVPAPGTLLLVLAGLGGLAGLRRRI